MRNELRHYGIKGQKWGVRNGPPYPLKERKHSSRLLELAKESMVVARVRTRFERKQHLSTNTGKIKPIKVPHSEAQDQRAVNKDGYESTIMQYRMNCMMCSAAYELRRRGYDVKAMPTAVGRDFGDFSSWFKNTTKKDFIYSRKYTNIKAELMKQPDGARGNICAGVGSFDSYHSMVWEKKKGKIIIRDCQSDTTYDSIDKSVIRQKSRHKYGFIRTDNLEINWDTVRDAVTPK